MNEAAALDRHAERLHAQGLERVHRRTDRIFLYLLPLQWLFGILIATVATPQTWIGTEGSTHVHLWAAVLLGGAANLVPAFLAWKQSGAALTRYAIAIGQLTFCALLIHLTGGRIETHFYVFGSLAFLAAYRDWKVLLVATVIVAVEHLIRGMWFPRYVFGAFTASPWRVLEHAAYVLFEDLILLITMGHSLAEMRAASRAQARAALLTTQLRNEKAEVETRIQEAVQASLRDKVDSALHGIQAISAGVTLTARSTNEMAERARRSSLLATTGSQKLGETNEHIRGLVNDVQRSLDKVKALEASSLEIGEVSSLIQKVAFQTNLLALNAAVESARAGEHGRGFAVVADEVRTLAGNTSKAAARIEEIARAINGDARETAAFIASTASGADESISRADEAESALREIDLATEEITRLLEELASTTEQQSSQSQALAAQVQDLGR